MGTRFTDARNARIGFDFDDGVVHGLDSAFREMRGLGYGHTNRVRSNIADPHCLFLVGRLPTLRGIP
jgi:hypothetical protein